MKKTFVAIGLLLLAQIANAQDTTKKTSKWTNHFQLTVIGQKHSGFKAPYSGTNSLADTVEPTATSLTSTLFLGRKLWKGAAFYFNPEVSGGNGLSFATGVAGALNGETYRIGEVRPRAFVARAYLEQHIPLKNTKYEFVEDDVNQVAGYIPVNRITISAGKFSIADFFDNNNYCKDPRTQFFNWSLWANGAWDYPANTRGYTYGIVAELIKTVWSLRFSSVAVPRIANYHLMEYRFDGAHSETLEFEHKFSINRRPGTVRLIISRTHSQSPSYADGMKAIATGDKFLLDVIQGLEEHKQYGGHKYAFGINLEQQLTSDIGIFSRIGWNDGKYATWAFTEIDRTINFGVTTKGTKWKRADDYFGIAGVLNGISNDHHDFLKAGGYGFIIGDGSLTYGNEGIIETFYNARFNKFLWITLDYQFVINPAYNKDRGPVHVFGIRSHVEF
ncbi:MAG: carbohydrate porin [Chitinophagaceae bacterium]|nr:carbohydrate porin [Chitinophagaceae bacterium]